jgi:hypothetical protein
MDPLHPPLLIGRAKPPKQLRIALGRLRHKLYFLLSRLTPKPAARLVLIGRPGTGKTMLSHQILLIGAAEPQSPWHRACQFARNLMPALRFRVITRKSSAGPDQSRGAFSGKNENSSVAATEFEFG